MSVDKKRSICIVVATYNGERYIIEELLSIKNQTIKPNEVIISDDCSTDNTYQLIQDFIKENNLTNWRLLKNKKNKGFSKNFLEAATLSKSDLIFFADQDDIWMENKIEIMISVFSSFNNVKAVASEIVFIDSYSNPIKIPKKIPNTNFVYDKKIIQINNIENLISSFIRGCTMCVTNDIIKLINSLNIQNLCSNNLLGHDWVLWTLASLMGDTYIYRDALIKYRVHDKNTSLNALQRKTLVGDFEKRICGLKKSIDVHNFILVNKYLFTNYDDQFDNILKQCINFEKKRLLFLDSKKTNYFLYLNLLFNQKFYKRYYRNYLKGIKVCIGDFLYHKKNKCFK